MKDKGLKFGVMVLAVITFIVLVTPAQAADWAVGIYYNVGDIVTYNGDSYQCLQAHTSQSNWKPPNTPALWQLVTVPNPGGNWSSGASYSIGDKITYNGQEYICRQSHVAQSDWTPPATPALWEANINPTYSEEIKNYLEQLYNATELQNWTIISVDKSIKIVTYNVEIENKVSGERINNTWIQRLG